MEIFVQVFDDQTGMRIVTQPNESLEREETVIQMRVQTGSNTTKLVKCVLTDPETGEDLYPRLEDAILQGYMKREGKQCEHCKRYYMPTSPSQKQCPACKEQK